MGTSKVSKMGKECYVGLGAAAIALGVGAAWYLWRKAKQADMNSTFEQLRMAAFLDLADDLETLFRETDTNADGKLSFSELRKALETNEKLQHLFLKNDRTILEVFNQIDTEHHEYITLGQFTQFLVPSIVVEVKLWDIFSAADTDHNGRLSRSELEAWRKNDSSFRALLSRAGVGNAEDSNLFEMMDTNGDGDIDLKEFLGFFITSIRAKGAFPLKPSSSATALR